MDNLAKPTNRALFLVSVAVTGALAGAAVWLFFFAMEHGIDYLWTEVPHMLGASSPELASGPFGFLPYPFFCLPAGRLGDWPVRKDDGRQDRRPQPGHDQGQARRSLPVRQSGQAVDCGAAAVAVWRKYWTGGRPDRRYRGYCAAGSAIACVALELS